MLPPFYFLQVDPDLYNSMKWILDNDISEVLDHTFCVDSDSFGQRRSHELKPNGSEIAVTEENKREYVRLYVNWRFLRGIEAQFLSLSKVCCENLFCSNAQVGANGKFKLIVLLAD